MSLSKPRVMIIVALAVAALIFLSGWGGFRPPVQPTPIVCPAMVTVSETAVPIAGWSLHSDQTQHPFERISVLNKDDQKEYDLAPDTQKQSGAKTIQTWNLQAYRDMPIVVTCRYQGTSLTLSKIIPKSTNTCSQNIELDNTGKIVGQPSMSCQ